MGSRLSRAAAPCVKADASAVVPAYHNTQRANASPNRQGSTSRLSEPLSQDDIVLKSPATLPAVLRRRNSAPAPTSPDAATVTTIKSERELTAAFDLFYAEHCLMSIQLPNDEPEVPALAPLSIPAEKQPSQPQVHHRLYCIICVATLPEETDLDFTKQVIQPCGECGSLYCPSCIKRMFVEACTDMTRMPPRCCIPINLSHARPHLSQDEIQLFKAKYEEWLTPSPFYCPVATCSAFIPARHLPGRTGTNGKRKDSGTGTPTSKTFACPTCEANICLDCRQIAHPCNPCNVSEFGLDEETTMLLKSWGYKQCPKCRHGLKRMHGCNHMECRCGAHFCYVCLGDPLACGGDCHLSDDEDDDDNESLSSSDENQVSAVPGEISPTQEGTQSSETHNVPAPNLDGGGSSYWANQDRDFGEEPGEDYADPFWNCPHSFMPHKIELAQALTRDPSEAAMECVKCWSTTYPAIKLANVHRRAGRQVAGRHSTTLRRNSTPGCPISHRVPLLDPSLIDANDPSTQQLRDLYGNVVYPAEPAHHHHRRRASMHDLMAASSSQDVITTSSSLITASTPSDPSSTGISLANECTWCKLLVCDSCKDDLMAARKHKA